jgi:acetyl-CoA carboxylase carboxyltransferase component
MPAPVLPTAVDTGDEAFRVNSGQMLRLLAEINRLLSEAARGGGDKAIERHRGRGKLLIRERIALLLDPDTPFLELSPLAGYQTNYAVGGGMVLGIGVVREPSASSSATTRPTSAGR